MTVSESISFYLLGLDIFKITIEKDCSKLRLIKTILVLRTDWENYPFHYYGFTAIILV